jgi:predicted GH43/DUF377 family glycosyl hydrolase
MHEHLHALAIHAYYAGEIETGRRASDRLLNLPLPEEMERQARSNRTWYTHRLADIAPEATFRRIEIEPAAPGWSLFNPSIVTTPDGFLGIVRSSNYRIDEAGHYKIPEEDAGAIRTQNILVKWDDDFVVRSAKTITEPDYGRNGYPVHGLEDCRLRSTDGGFAVSATVRDADGWDGRCRVATASLDIETATLSAMRVLECGALDVHEKNWMPFGPEAWVYACNKTGRVVTVEGDPNMPGCYQMLGRGASPRIAAGFRGGSQLIPWEGGFLAVIHEVAQIDASPGRAYEHRFVLFDSSFSLRAMSPLFAFQRTRDIEFAAGIAVAGEALHVSFGSRDAEAWIASIPTERVKWLLAPVS